jgi:hypothetical protein
VWQLHLTKGGLIELILFWVRVYSCFWFGQYDPGGRLMGPGFFRLERRRDGYQHRLGDLSLL